MIFVDPDQLKPIRRALERSAPAAECVGVPRPNERTQNRNTDLPPARRRNLSKAGSPPGRPAQRLPGVCSRDAGNECNAFGAFRARARSSTKGERRASSPADRASSRRKSGRTPQRPSRGVERCRLSSKHPLQAACSWPLKAAPVRFVEETTISRHSAPPSSGAPQWSSQSFECCTALRRLPTVRGRIEGQIHL